ncbi:hypothetical protein PR002_g19659 [Phytophthora rubi]|uniref:PDZ domain-containing protein n=2 Tax=Phytophthora rubi TaxID=129364 RepID=A0A6A3JPC1_9STRA|nr:hypothetical protein PR002_g19659 [Phytophthora rubi]
MLSWAKSTNSGYNYQNKTFFSLSQTEVVKHEGESVATLNVGEARVFRELVTGIQECAVVHGFTNLPTGEKGPIEQHGDVYPGMYIMSINETNASLMSLQQVTELLGRLARKEKLIRFAVFRPGSPRNRSSMDTASEVSNQRMSITSSASLPPPVPVATKPPTPSWSRQLFLPLC